MSIRPRALNRHLLRQQRLLVQAHHSNFPMPGTRLLRKPPMQPHLFVVLLQAFALPLLSRPVVLPPLVRLVVLRPSLRLVISRPPPRPVTLQPQLHPVASHSCSHLVIFQQQAYLIPRGIIPPWRLRRRHNTNRYLSSQRPVRMISPLQYLLSHEVSCRLRS